MDGDAGATPELDRFVRATSHAVAAPAGTLRGFLDILRGQMAGSDAMDGEEILDHIERQVVVLRELAVALSTYAAVGHGDAPVPVPLAPVVDESIEALATDIATAGARVEVGPLPTVVGTHDQLVVLLTELLRNAIRFRESGRAPRVQVSATTTPDGGAVRLAVRDDGIGIDPRFRAEVFAPYRQLQSRREFGGLGMGLAICARVVARHGGSIRIDDATGAGTTVLAELPLAPSP